jgi:hypothetical protein
MFRKKGGALRRWRGKGVILLAVVMMSGCSARNLYFGTATQIGLDVSGTAQVPNRVSLGYGRVETAYVPNKPDGTAHSVMGSLDSDITWFSGQRINQVLATGEAAQNAAGSNHSVGQQVPCQKESTDDRAPLYFGTVQSFGVDLSFGGNNVAPGLVVGYKRAEGTVIPIVDPSCEVRPVYADISIDSTSHTGGAPEAAASQIGGVRIVQRFATGQAAIEMTSEPEIANNLKSAVSGGVQGSIHRAGLEKEIKSSFDELGSTGQGNVLDWAEKTFAGKKWTKDGNGLKYGLLPQLTDQERSSLLDEINKESQQ